MRALQAVLEWQEKEHERQLALASATGNAVDAASRDAEDAAAASQFVAFVPLPDQKVSKARGGVVGGLGLGACRQVSTLVSKARGEAAIELRVLEKKMQSLLANNILCACSSDSPCFALIPDASAKAIELRVLEKKKQDLLAKYATSEFQSQQQEAKSLLNKK